MSDICKKYPVLADAIFEKKFWCQAPFSSISMSVDGEYSLCCIARDFKDTILNMTLEEYYNSPIVREIRKEMLSGEPGEYCKHYCHKCLTYERLGINSRRITSNRSVVYMSTESKYDHIVSKLENTVKRCLNDEHVQLADMGFSLLDFKIFGNLCNLKCIMCHPDSSSLVAKEYKELGLWDGPLYYNPYEEMTSSQKDVFYQEMTEILKNTFTIRFTGGEPILSKATLEFLYFVVKEKLAPNLNIHVTTNGTTISEEFMSLLMEFDSINLSLSVDAYGDLNDLQRRNSSFSVIDKNIDFYKSYIKPKIYLVPTVTSFTCGTLANLQYYSMYKLNKPICTNICLTPFEFSIIHLPDEIRELYISRLTATKYTDTFRNVLRALENGTYNEIYFKSYLTRILDLYGVDRILKYFPEYKDYVV